MMKLVQLTNSKRWKKDHFRQFAMTCLMLFIGVGYSTAQTFDLTECICQNNDSPQFEGLFEETISISNTASGASWEIVSAIGLYDQASTPQNLIPLAMGSPIPETAVGSGIYEIMAFRLDNTDWTAVVTDGTNSFPLQSTNTCRYPGAVLLGDTRACLEDSEIYTIDNDPGLLSAINWSIVGGGTLESFNGAPSMEVQYGNIEGAAILSVDFTSAAYAGQGAGKCVLTQSLTIFIEDEMETVLACNNKLNISMNNNCELFVTPDMLLEDQAYPNDSYHVVLRDIQADTIIPNGVISMVYLDKQVEARVVHECSLNSCWGLLTLEDKNIPSLICNPDTIIDCSALPEPEETGFPVPDDAVVTKVRDGVYTVIGFDKCTELTMRFEDMVESVHCNGDFSSVISRSWSIMDDAGNVDTCSNKIFIRKASIDDITFPENYDDNTGPNPSIKACSFFPTLPNGHPDPYAVGGTGAPMGMFCLNVIVKFEDRKIIKCGKGDISFKLRRKWIVTDLCTAEQREHTQSIVVKDDAAPICKKPDNFTAGTAGLSCGAEIKVPPVEVTFECSPWDYEVSYKAKDGSGNIYDNATKSGVIRNQDSTYTITNVPGVQDTLWIIYTLTDECGNMSQCFSEVYIKDDLPPTPVCDQNSFVGLNDQGIAYAGVLTFDDGSNDNCGVDKLEIMRVNASPCGQSAGWTDKIKFCCDDLGKETMVALRVTDKAGNNNTCMVLVQVQDNQPPVLENCPKDRTVNCDADIVNLLPFGFPTVFDFCGADIEEQPAVRDIDNCGKGYVRRTFIATDKSGNTDQCTQTIFVQPTNPFRASDIRWPGNHTVHNGCMDSGIEPEDLPNGKQIPGLPNPKKPCSNVTYDHDDVVFQFTDGACFKILREWTVLDWCAYNGITGEGLYTYTQVIMVHNNVDPDIVKGCNDADLEVTDLGDCRSRIILQAEGEDDCSLPTSLKWNYKLDVGNDGSVEFDVNSSRIDRIIDHGEFKVTWTVTDECDNSSECSKVFMVDDQKKPTPYCLTELVTVIMQDTKQVAIWAKDYNRNSSDNCTLPADLKFSFSEDLSHTSEAFTCEDLVDGELVQDLKMYVTDKNGNFDFCQVSIRIQDNSGHCDETIQRVVLGGKVTNESNDIVEDVDVRLSADLAEFPIVTQLGGEGDYAFDNLIMYTDYTIDPYKGGNYLDGVSTLDLVLIQRHILGIEFLNSAYKVIAADVTSDDRVTASDLVELRKLILGINAEFTNSDNWRFIDSEKTFSNPKKPFPYQSDMVMEQLDHDEMGVNFIALKVGDVNNSHETNFRGTDTENRSSKEWTIAQSSVNDLTTVSIIVNESNLAGFQMAFEFDPNAFIFEGVEGNQINLNSSNLGLARLDEGIVMISWNSNEAYNVEGKLITLLLSNKGLDNSQVSINPGIMSPEAYKVEGGIETYKIDFRSETSDIAGGFELFQNIPNPFDNSTKIGFSLDKQSKVTLKVYDYSGKLLLQKNGEFNKGYNSIDLNVNELNASGVMYYQIETDTQYASRKMIVIK